VNQYKGLLAVVALAAIALLLAGVSSGFQGVEGWLSFLAALLVGAGLLWGGWRALRGEAPRWLAWLTLGAALLRLGAGVLWYTALPVAGYGSPAERQGYIMADAYERDRSAWDLARSDKPLWKAFAGGYRKADQYGGLLFLSALIYRYLGGESHQPLLMVIFTAAFSALAIPFTWAFTRRAWGDHAARLAAWGLALYPEAVLLGSSQMREAFMITLTSVAFYGLLLFWQEHSWRGALWLSGALGLMLPFSPPGTALALVALVIQAMAMSEGVSQPRLARRRGFWMALGGLALLIALGLWLTWRQYAPPGTTSPLGVLEFWVRKSAGYQAYLSQRASGWVQKIFDSTPEWTHVPLLLLYGVVQPFLPAAIGDLSGTALWRAIALWRALGWTMLLPFLLYAPLRAWQKVNGDPKAHSMARIGRGASWAVWGVILIASFRSGGDPWDNPRYRAMFAGLQIALAAWVWVEQRRRPDPWLRRILVGAALILAWFLPWYLRRYLHLNWPVVDFFKTLGLGVFSTILYWVWDGVRRATR